MARKTTHPTFAGPWGNGSPQAHDRGQFGGSHDPKEADVLGRSFGHVVSSPEVFLVAPYLLHLVDLRAHEVSRGSHVPEGRREVI